MFNIFQEYTPKTIRDSLDSAMAIDINYIDTGDLVQAIMVLCDYIDKLEGRIESLENINASQVDMNVKYK